MLTQGNMGIIAIFAISIFLAYSFIWFIFKTPLINLFRDKPGLRKVHQRVIPRIGGIAILAGFLILLGFWHFYFKNLEQLPSELISALIFAACSVLVVGLVDDMVIFKIHNKAKLILELLIAAEIVFLFKIQLNELHFLNWDCTLGWLGIPITIIWIVGVTNAVNIIDGVDGLAGSVMAIIFTTIAVLTGFRGDTEILILCMILAGLVIGFLRHNISPARVFLGDTGSLFLGIMAGVLSIYLISKRDFGYPLLIAPLVVGLPILDVFVAMVRRFLKKILGGAHWFNALGAMSVADNEHMHHRLIYRGLTHSETVLILLLFHAVICMSAIMVMFTNNLQSVALLLYVFILSMWFLYKLHFFDRFTIFFENRRTAVISKRINVVVVNAGEVLKYSLQKYKQNTFAFNFCSADQILSEPGKYSAVIIEQNKEKIDKVIVFASAVFTQNTCPVIVVASDGDNLPPHLANPEMEQGSFFLLKKPIYIPVLFSELSRLIRQSRSWMMEKATEDTRQFLLQAVMHEEI